MAGAGRGARLSGGSFQQEPRAAAVARWLQSRTDGAELTDVEARQLAALSSSVPGLGGAGAGDAGAGGSGAAALPSTGNSVVVAGGEASREVSDGGEAGVGQRKGTPPYHIAWGADRTQAKMSDTGGPAPLGPLSPSGRDRDVLNPSPVRKHWSDMATVSRERGDRGGKERDLLADVSVRANPPSPGSHNNHTEGGPGLGAPSSLSLAAARAAAGGVRPSLEGRLGRCEGHSKTGPSR